MDVLDPNVPCDFWGRVLEAQSKHPASKKTDFPVKHEFVSWEYTHHNDGSSLHGQGVEVLPSGAVRIHQRATLPKGLSTTIFHNGFQRRKQSGIRQDEARLQREASKQRLSMIHLERRRQRLGMLDKRNGFSLAGDTIYCRSTTPFHVQPKTRETGPLSDVAERSEYLLLRDSKYKFHAPAWSGKNHDKRQDLLQREGLNKPKYSTLLGIGGADLASAGANDMFSKAIYDPAKTCAVEGLVETSIPGRYTPRKVAAARETVATANSIAAPVALEDDEENRGDGGGGVRTPSSSTNVLFRVVPNGLGKHGVLADTGGSAVPGIAPPKILCGSRSSPIIGSQGSKVNAPSREPHLVQASSPGGGISARSARSSPRSGSTFAERLQAVTRAVNMASARDDGGSGSVLRGSRTSSRGLTRSKSDCGGEKGGTGGEEVGFRKSRSATSAQSPPAKSASPGWPSLGSSRTRGASPAQRRNDDQLAIDGCRAIPVDCFARPEQREVRSQE